MDRHVSLPLIVCGAAALALWIDVRFPGLMPARLTKIVLHALAGLAAARFLAPAVMRELIGISEAVPVSLFALVGVFVPALIYVFLGAIWLLKSLRDGVTA